MGVSSSKIEDDKALLLCRERRHFVRQALDGRCSLAAAHVSYIQSLRNTGKALRKFVEPDYPVESSLYTSTSATPEPLGVTEKSASQFSNSSPSHSQHVETVEPFSPVPSSPYSGRFHVNYMKSGGNVSTTIEERPPISMTATVRSSSETSSNTTHPSGDASTFDAPTPWDYFGLFHPIDNQFSFQDGSALNHRFDDADDIKRLREEEGIPELEETEKSSSHGQSEFFESDDEFDEPSTEPLVRIFKNRNEDVDSRSTNGMGGMTQAIDEQNRKAGVLADGALETSGTLDVAPSKATNAVVTSLINGKKEVEKEPDSENKLPAKDFLSSMKEIEYLFLKASESGKEVPRMLEANKVHFRPLFPEGEAHRSKASTFFTSCLICCVEEENVPQVVKLAESAPSDKMYLTWHGSVSSRSSSSRNPLGANSKDDVHDIDSKIFSSICMNSGSHASTLDRLYAWERKLYDEVKASGIIRKEYDMKCKLLRQQDSRGESPYKIDKTRATIKDLHSRIRVAIQRIDSISKRIEDLRDKELQPQLEELIGGLSRMWKMMLECHKLQHTIISTAYNNGSSKVSIRSESHRQATILLEHELSIFCSSFTKWISSHKSYLQAIYGWLLKCVFPVNRHKSSRRRQVQFSPRRDIAPPIYVTCRDWLTGLDNLNVPIKDLTDSVKDLEVETTRFVPQQDKNHGKLAFSLPRKAGGHKLSDDIQRNDDQVDWSMDIDSLQSRSTKFLDQLKKFAEGSVKMYEDLGEAIGKARYAYEHPEIRK